MPVPTDTFWDIKKLNVVFAAAALLLLTATGLLVMADWNRGWREYQRQGRVWETALTEEAAANAMNADRRAEVRKIEDRISKLKADLKSNDNLKQLEARLAELQAHKAAASLPTAVVKGEIGPKIQQIERAVLEHGEDSPQVRKLREELAKINEKYQPKFIDMSDTDREIASVTEQVMAKRKELADAQKLIDGLTRERKSAEDKIAELDPKGPAKIGQIVRNAPLSDWFNPSEKPLQVVTQDIRTDVNFFTVETIDRCMTCHVNIDKPRFSEHELIAFAERQLAVAQEQDVNTIDKPVVLIEFWVRSLELASHGENAGALAGKVARIRENFITELNAVRAKAGDKPVDAKIDLLATLGELALKADTLDKDGKTALVKRSEWYAPLANFRADAQAALREHLGKEQYKTLTNLYRYQLVDAFNAARKDNGQAALSASPVLLAHPKIDLFVDPDSKHPMKTMGCTSCHEGSGQETEFKHTAHTPRDLWVDAKSGAPVPHFLIEAAANTRQAGDPKKDAVAPGHAAKAAPGFTLDGAQVAYASAGADDHAAAEHVRFTHQDVKLTDPTNPAPFAPVVEPHAHKLGYLAPATAKSATPVAATAVRQRDFWTKAYAWEEVHYMHWEKPMHSLEYVESSCIKCHTEVFDVKETAPRLYEGRKLFAQLGCANCHTIESVNKQLDVKKVGPSLVHVKDKLSAEMMASWIWSPRAFRPTTRMPHFFMLENNSSPVDILRTRTETAAITYYLQNTPPAADKPEYTPAQPPTEKGDTKNGKVLFNSLGCLACHTNLNEHGEKWITDDLVKKGATPDDAKKQFQAMGYQKQHWYALEHLQEKLVLVGPELSGVGTKLKTGRTSEQARAWVYDWLINPRHYSSYTIMPSFRLAPAEANDLAAYLLSQERPDYKAEDFLKLDDQGKAMLEELVVNLRAGQVTTEFARDVIRGKKADPATGKTQAWSTEDQLGFLGQKMVTHYGCNGCHEINGLAAGPAPCANLDADFGWGLKDPHKLDFGYFDHAFNKDREKPIDVWKVDHEGLASNAPQIRAQSDAAHDPAIKKVAVAWEEMELERRPWLYNKLHNTRIYDRGRSLIEGSLQANKIEVGRPYDKIKMPKFFLTDEQVRSVVTFVTSVRKPLVSESIQKATYNDARLRAVKGRQLATMYNCYGCHNIEGNDVHLHEFYDVWNPDGTKDPAKLNELAPPRLIGQGSRTQPEWLFHFLQNVHPLRPWLKVRMPSFPMTAHDATGLVDYFAGEAQDRSSKIGSVARTVLEATKDAPDKDWYKKPRFATQVAKLRDFALQADLAKPSSFDPRKCTEEDLAQIWNGKVSDTGVREQVGLLDAAAFLGGLYKVDYPFPVTPRPMPDDERFARGEAIYNELKCYTCHQLGDETKLMEAWKLNNANVKPAAAAAGADDPYADEGDAKKADAKKADAKKTDDDGYGDESADAAPPPPPVVGPPNSAPNLRHAARRLQWNWVHHWLMEPATMQPGTKMPQWFAEGKSAYKKYGDEMDSKFQSKYGYSGAEQMKLVMDFVYSSSANNHTHYLPEWTKLPAGVERKTVELKPLEPPKPDPKAIAAEKSKPTAEAKPADPKPTETKAAAPAVKKEEPKVSSIKLHEGTQAAESACVVGVAKFEGKPARARPLDMNADAFCAKAHAEPVPNPQFLVNADGTLPNTLIYVKSGLPAGFKIEKPSEPIIIDQYGCMYHPMVTGVMVGQTVRVINSDPTLHNVKGPNFNIPQPAQGMKTDKVFSKTELVPLRCDVHGWMVSYVHVLSNPWFTTTDVQGRFEIKGLPPGKYVLEAWHPMAVADSKNPVAPRTFEVEVTEKTSTRADVTLSR